MQADTNDILKLKSRRYRNNSTMKTRSASNQNHQTKTIAGCSMPTTSLTQCIKLLIEVKSLLFLASAFSAILMTNASAYGSEKHNHTQTSKINGKPIPAKLLPLEDSTVMLDTLDADGKRLYITKGTRRAGTRAAIHTHQHGGHTCVLSGEITSFIEGAEPVKRPAGTCYYMPPNTPMSATNLGSKDAVIIDTFLLPPGEEEITLLEQYPK